MNSYFRKITKILFPFLTIILIWQLFGYFNLLNEYLLPTPFKVIKALINLSQTGELFLNVMNSLKRVFIGFILASLFGITLGVGSGYFKKLSEFLLPLFEALRPIPPIAWIPIAVLWFGLGDSPAYFIVFIGAFFPIFTNSYWAVRANKLKHVNLARNFNASKFFIIKEIIIPSSLPRILTGLRIGLGLAWTSVIAAELVGAQSGLGYMIQMNRIMLRPYNIIAGMITIGLIGLIMNQLMLIIEKKLTSWNQGTLEPS
jgi:NitT/TauT family transport system permease protein/sulfonate transport system permease protein